MKKCILFLLLLSNMAIASSVPKLDLFKTLGGSGDDGAYDLVIDHDENIYVLGWYTGSIDLNPSAVSNFTTAFGNRDIFLAKYDSSGNYIWGFGIGSVGQDEGNVITLDSSGNVIIAGRFSGSLDFDPSINVNFKVSNGNRDIYLAKYDSLGNLVWVNSMGGNLYDDAEDVLVDTVGNIYLAGSFQTTVDFDPEGGVDLRVSNGLSDAYLACYSPAGIFNWVSTFGGNLDDDLAGIELWNNGSIYCSGYFTGSTDFDGNAGIHIVSSLGDADAFILKYDIQGNFHWVETLGGTGYDAAYGLDIFKDLIYFTGTFSDSVDFNPGIGVALKISGGSGDIFLCQFDSIGNFNWVNSAGGTGLDMGLDVAIDAFGNVINTGLFRGNSSFSGGSATQNLFALGDRDIYIDLFESSGDLLSVFAIGSFGVDNVRAFYFDRSNNVIYIPGVIGGITDFDPDSIIVTPMSFSGVSDIFFAKYHFCDSLTALNDIFGSNIVCEGDTLSYTVDSLISCVSCRWIFPPGSILLDSTGADVLFVAGGVSGFLEVFIENTCFASDTLRKSISSNSRPMIFVSDSICTGATYFFPDGSTGSTDTIQSSYFTAASGCDSIIVTNLKVTQPIIDLDTVVICNGSSYNYNGSNLSVTGLYSHTISTPGFCDTTHSLQLIVLPPNLFLQNKTLCDGDTLWVGSVAHTTGGVFIDTLLSSLFCDSIVISNLNMILVDTTVSISSGVYTSNQTNAVYQWYECGPVLTPIPNAIFQSYAMPLNGSYAVVVNVNGCIDTSRCFNATNTSIDDLSSTIGKVFVAPNPLEDHINISSFEIIEDMCLYSIEGKILRTEELNVTFFRLNMNDFMPALYILKVRTKSQFYQFRILKM